MKYVKRHLENTLSYHLKRGKSILLLGPRQAGKTTLLSKIPADLMISFLRAGVRQRYEKDLSTLEKEILALPQKKPLVIIDEIQKIPQALDSIQYLIDEKVAQFILTGSSARKLRQGNSINLLPGRIVQLYLDPLSQNEYKQDIEKHLLYGSLPEIALTEKLQDKEMDLQSYVETYLEQEVRSEALVRNMGHFLRFLEFSGLESGKISNFHKLSQEIGVSQGTIASYFQILEDCLIAHRIDPLSQSSTRKKLTKSSKYFIFDMGVRRLCANEGKKLGNIRLGELFEQFVGIELIKYTRQAATKTNIRFWRDPDGPELDWLIETDDELIPIEVKWTQNPTEKHTKHLKTFLKEYPKAQKAYVICQTENTLQLSKNIQAISWKDIFKIIAQKQYD